MLCDVNMEVCDERVWRIRIILVGRVIMLATEMVLLIMLVLLVLSIVMLLVLFGVVQEVIGVVGNENDQENMLDLTLPIENVDVDMLDRTPPIENADVMLDLATPIENVDTLDLTPLIQDVGTPSTSLNNSDDSPSDTSVSGSEDDSQSSCDDISANDLLKDIRIKNINRLIIGTLNINFIAPNTGVVDASLNTYRG